MLVRGEEVSFTKNLSSYVVKKKKIWWIFLWYILAIKNAYLTFPFRKQLRNSNNFLRPEWFPSILFVQPPRISTTFNSPNLLVEFDLLISSAMQLLVSYEIYSAEYLLSNPISFLQRSLHLLQHNNWPSKMRKTSISKNDRIRHLVALRIEKHHLENNNYKNNL